MFAERPPRRHLPHHPPETHGVIRRLQFKVKDWTLKVRYSVISATTGFVCDLTIEPFHLFRYLDEQVFRFNEREMTDSERFLKAMSSIVGRRLTYKSPN
jgi:hypothetical protein